MYIKMKLLSVLLCAACWVAGVNSIAIGIDLGTTYSCGKLVQVLPPSLLSLLWPTLSLPCHANNSH